MPPRAVLLLGLLWRCAIATKQECAVCEDTIGHLAASAAARARSEQGVRQVLDAYCAQDRLRTAEAQMCYVLEPMRQHFVGFSLEIQKQLVIISTRLLNLLQNKLLLQPVKFHTYHH